VLIAQVATFPLNPFDDSLSWFAEASSASGGIPQIRRSARLFPKRGVFVNFLPTDPFRPYVLAAHHGHMSNTKRLFAIFASSLTMLESPGPVAFRPTSLNGVVMFVPFCRAGVSASDDPRQHARGPGRLTYPCGNIIATGPTQWIETPAVLSTPRCVVRTREVSGAETSRIGGCRASTTWLSVSNRYHCCCR